jgi:UDP-N-acetylmuramate dehydrogenase
VKDGCEVTLENVRKVIIQIRKTKLPDTKVMGNAGSFFMNPIVDKAVFENIQKEHPAVPHYEVSGLKVKIPAAWLIEKCGYKGFRTGHVGVHDIQPLVLVNCGGAEAGEIIELASMIIEAVRNKFGITISPEVNYI